MLAGGGTPENVAYVETLLGNLHFQRGDIAAASAAYRSAQSRVPDFLGAQVGLATIDASRGDLAAAIDGFRAAVAVSPVHEYNVLLLEAQLAAGHIAAARRTAAEIRKYQAIERRRGVDTDAESIFEAEHGSKARAVELGRAAVAKGAERRLGRRLLLGADERRERHRRPGLGPTRAAPQLTGPPVSLPRRHRGQAAGKPALTRRWLTAALARNPRFSPLHAPKARSALRSIASLI